MAYTPGAYIQSRGRSYGLDPRALIAVAMGEGGLVNRAGDIGDLSGGGSYGPFQLYAQGALPQRFRGRPQAADAWAWSPAGIDYALRQMVKAGAGGLVGRAAVEAIIRKFERPADPEGSISRALGRYGEGAEGASAPMYAAPSAPAGRMPSPSPMSVQPRRRTLNPLTQGILASSAQRDPRAQTLSIMGALMSSARQAPPPSVSSAGPARALAPAATAAAGPGVSLAGGGDFLSAAVGGANYSNLGGPGAHQDRALGNWQSDNAWDLGVPVGTPIYAVADGVIGPRVGVQSSRPRDGQRLTLIGGPHGQYWYGHMSQIHVKPGQRVRRGQLLGYSGASQNGAAHLHLGAMNLR